MVLKCAEQIGVHKGKKGMKYMESELGISAASIYRVLTENLGYIKVCAKIFGQNTINRRCGYS